MTAKGEKIAALYMAEQGRLQRQITRRVGCSSTAGDLVQDIFLRLWERATDWTGEPAAYLNRCARNAAIDHLRAETRRSTFFAGIMPEQYAAAPATPEAILAARQDVQRVDDLLALLPQRTRHIFILNRIHGRSFSEIAMVMNISKRAVEKHMAKAVAACAGVAAGGD
ncbi:RNA polymerase sigma factor [Gemmobacter serpentinus]|uniref:RNA polymerase sigma factor n=1 Tax=Gemmobacter serpentinus TaxID=2652247 RepID=UPI00124C9160|nr:sigma-70 family RNA polymerase sigma factor [Gemmobacter serpentinus]